MYDGVNLPRHAKSNRASVDVKGTRCQGMQDTLVTLSLSRRSADPQCCRKEEKKKKKNKRHICLIAEKS